MKKFIDSTRDFVNEWTINILILLFGTTTLVQAFIVPTPSMDPTVLVGDHLLVDKLSYSPPGAISKYFLPYTEPRRGDVIVFRYPMDIQQNYVKRVMGVPGDHLRLVNKVVYLNGHALNEPYAVHIDPHIDPYRDDFPDAPVDGPVYPRATQMFANQIVNGELVVPPGYFFAMGDNRDNSLDSRYWGFVPRENIIGKPLVIFWSYDAPTEDWVDYNANHFIDLAEHFFTRTRWDRELKLIRGIRIQ
ncbi:MAG TPA: signal peptidase I [Bryobacteraceae bacterium]|jgi:signal peptidase I|nr:signal peptidase I [Bryobacteraceae bacterium]